MQNLEHHFLHVNDITLHVVTAGPKEGEPVLLLQVLKSWYIFFFQVPFFPEWVIRLGSQHSPFLLDVSSFEHTFSAVVKAKYLKAWRQPGPLTGMLNWYRALRFLFNKMPEPVPNMIKVPSLILWGEQDIALRKELAIKSLELCENGSLYYFPNASHWVQHDEADAVTQQLSNFFN